MRALESEYVFLIEKEEIWGRMLLEVLRDNSIPCVAEPVYGAGQVWRTGMQEWLRIYVPEDCHDKASDLVEELFSAEFQEDGDGLQDDPEDEEF